MEVKSNSKGGGSKNEEREGMEGRGRGGKESRKKGGNIPELLMKGLYLISRK